METNITNCTNITYFWRNEECLWYYSHKELFWTLMSIFVVVALAGVPANVFVIYVATQKRHMVSGFRYLNHAVKSLAITDICLNLFGTPATVVYLYWSKNLHLSS